MLSNNFITTPNQPLISPKLSNVSIKKTNYYKNKSNKQNNHFKLLTKNTIK